MQNYGQAQAEAVQNPNLLHDPAQIAPNLLQVPAQVAGAIDGKMTFTSRCLRDGSTNLPLNFSSWRKFLLTFHKNFKLFFLKIQFCQSQIWLE